MAGPQGEYQSLEPQLLKAWTQYKRITTQKSGLRELQANFTEEFKGAISAIETKNQGSSWATAMPTWSRPR